MRDNGLPNTPFPVSVVAPTPPLQYLFYLRTRKRNFPSAALHSIHAKLESRVCRRIAFDRLPPTIDGGTRLHAIIIARSRRLASLRRSWVRVVRASPASSAQAVVQTPSAGSKRAGQSARLRVCACGAHCRSTRSFEIIRLVLAPANRGRSLKKTGRLPIVVRRRAGVCVFLDVLVVHQAQPV
ncbi:hypothetical protein MRX96_019457 [Rhipicephalus microplus]